MVSVVAHQDWLAPKWRKRCAALGPSHSKPVICLRLETVIYGAITGGETMTHPFISALRLDPSPICKGAAGGCDRSPLATGRHPQQEPQLSSTEATALCHDGHARELSANMTAQLR